jgi:hypothetical protein
MEKHALFLGECLLSIIDQGIEVASKANPMSNPLENPGFLPAMCRANKSIPVSVGMTATAFPKWGERFSL